MCLSVKQRGHSLEPSKYTLFFYQFLSYVQGSSSQALVYNEEKGWRILTWKSIGRHPFYPYPGCDMIDCNLVRRVRVQNSAQGRAIGTLQSTLSKVTTLALVHNKLQGSYIFFDPKFKTICSPFSKTIISFSGLKVIKQVINVALKKSRNKAFFIIHCKCTMAKIE